MPAAPWTATAAGHCEDDGQAVGDYIAVSIECSSPPVGSLNAPASDDNSAPTYEAYRWVNVCIGGFESLPGEIVDCAAARTCPDDGARLWRLWGQEPSGRWQPLYTQCRGTGSEGGPPIPEVTPALVLEALRRMGLPAVHTHTQPEDKTLVNFDTIFYAEPTTFRRTITLLGQQVEVEATPARFTWRPGDGTARTTTTPGRPYPAKDVTHRYERAHRTVQAAVDVTYTARFRVAGGGWQDIAETITVSGPPTPLRVAEATPVLSGDYS
jgi:hypothetical protein